MQKLKFSVGTLYKCAEIIKYSPLPLSLFASTKSTYKKSSIEYQKQGFTLQGQKCKLGLSEVKYLGNEFLAAGMQPGMQPDPEKIIVVRKWPNPANVAEV